MPSPPRRARCRQWYCHDLGPRPPTIGGRPTRGRDPDRRSVGRRDQPVEQLVLRAFELLDRRHHREPGGGSWPRRGGRPHDAPARPAASPTPRSATAPRRPSRPGWPAARRRSPAPAEPRGAGRTAPRVAVRGSARDMHGVYGDYHARGIMDDPEMPESRAHAGRGRLDRRRGAGSTDGEAGSTGGESGSTEASTCALDGGAPGGLARAGHHPRAADRHDRADRDRWLVDLGLERGVTGDDGGVQPGGRGGARPVVGRPPAAQRPDADLHQRSPDVGGLPGRRQGPAGLEHRAQPDRAGRPAGRGDGADPVPRPVGRRPGQPASRSPGLAWSSRPTRT